MMDITIDAASATPPYAQLLQQLVAAISDGHLAPGERLPAVRRLAEELGIAPNTVARTYRELEAEGVLVTRGRKGTFVGLHGDPVQQQAQTAARAYADRISELGLPADEGLALAESALRPGPLR
jgi:DNA-binding transcriptional regulator YhcF (GntR family)